MADFEIIVRNISSILGVIVLFLLLSFLYYRNIKDYIKYKEWNWTRVVLSLGIFVNFLDRLLFMFFYIFNWKFTTDKWMLDTIYAEPNLSILAILKGYLVVFGAIYVLYLNQKDELLIAPLLLYTGAVILAFTTTVVIYHYVFIFGVGVLTLILLNEAGISMRDNNAFGLGIMYVFIFAGGVIPNIIISNLIRLLAYIIGFTVITGMFKVFKKKEGEK